MIKLVQTAIIQCDTQEEYDMEKEIQNGLYGVGGVNEGAISYTLDDVAKTITFQRTIENFLT